LSLSFSAFEIFSARISKVTRSNVVGTSLPHIVLRLAVPALKVYAPLILRCERDALHRSGAVVERNAQTIIHLDEAIALDQMRVNIS